MARQTHTTLHTAGGTTLTVSVRRGTCTEAMLEDVTGRPDQDPSEYVSYGTEAGPLYHGLGVDGIKAYPNELNSSVDANGVVTYGAPGTAITDGGWLIEGPATNEFEDSNNLKDFAWTKRNCDATNPRTIIENSSSLDHSLIGEAAISSAGNYTLSCYVERTTRDYCWLQMYTGSDRRTVVFDLTDGSVLESHVASGSPSGYVDAIVELRTDYYRISTSIDSSGDFLHVYIGTQNDDSPVYSSAGRCNYAGNGTSGIIIEYVNVTADYLTSPIFTYGAAATRNDDYFEVAESLPQTEGTVAFRGTPDLDNTDQPADLLIAGMDDVAGAPYAMEFDAGTLSLHDDGSVTPTLGSVSWSAEDELEFGAFFSSDDNYLSYIVNGGSSTEGTSDTDAAAFGATSTIQVLKGLEARWLVDEVVIRDDILSLSNFQSGNWSSEGVSGSMAASETGADSFSSSGDVEISGSWASTDVGPDVFASAGVIAVSGSWASTDVGPDVFASAGAVALSGSMAATEVGVDVFSASGPSDASGSMAATETGPDVFASTGVVEISGTMSLAEVGPDTFASTGVLAVSGAFAANEVGIDTLSISGTVAISGSMDADEVGADDFSSPESAAFEVGNAAFGFLMINEVISGEFCAILDMKTIFGANLTNCE